MQHNTSPTSFREKKRAFALVMALGLMAFLVLLVITLAAIVQMELKVNKQAMLDNKARLLAKLAAYEALGEIQKTLGPDQRITANAAILDRTLDKVFDDIQEDDKYEWWTYPLADSRRNPATVRLENQEIEGIANPYWVGVWDATPGKHQHHRNPVEDATRESYSIRVMESAMTYLVSGNIIRRDGVDWSAGHLPDTMLTNDYINMVRKNSFTDFHGNFDATTMEVRVPLVKLEEDPDHPRRTHLEMRYAWWVSDESQKAPLDAVASAEEFASANRHANTNLQSMPFNSGIAALTNPMSGTRLFDINPTEYTTTGALERVRNLFELQQLNALQLDQDQGSPRASRMLFHSATFGTRGLLVNVRAGGLKKDLSIGLLRESGSEQNPTYFKRPLGVGGFDLAFDNANSGLKNRRFNPSNRLDNRGHMFGPQNPENILLTQRYMSASYSAASDDMRGFSTYARDAGGPLWDSLRHYYNSRVTSRTSSGEYPSTVRVQTDKDAGLSPVLQHFSMFYVPALRDYSGITSGTIGDYGVRIYMIPIIILWNPYDVPISPATYAFRLGNGATTSGSGRIAIGYQNGAYFECIRDTRTEKLPRPMKYELENFYETSLGSTDALIYTPSKYLPSLLTLDRKQLNAYRFVATDDRINNGSGMPYPIVSNASTQKITVDRMKGYENNVGYRAYNKTYLGYGPWTEADARLANGTKVQDTEGTDLLVPYSGDDRNLMPVVRFFRTKPVSFTRKRIGGGADVPIAYNFAEELPSSFAWRPLYLNDVRYSLARYGQSALSAGGGLHATNTITNGRRNTNHWDDAPRFLLKNAQGLQPGQALIFSFKKMVPYNGTHISSGGQNNGYAGRFSRAVSNQWWMDEGLDSVIGGLFVDIIHPEAAHFYSAADSYGLEGSDSSLTLYENNRFNGDNNPWVNLPSNPYASSAYDANQGIYTRKPLGVLFNIDEARTINGGTLDINNILVDFDFQINTVSAGGRGHILWMSPYGYYTPGVIWGPSTFTGTSTPPQDPDPNNPFSNNVRGGAHRDGFQFAPLIMWNYEDDNGTTALYEEIPGGMSNMSAGAFDKYHFQKLKTFGIYRSNSAAMGEHFRSFPDPLALAGVRPNEHIGTFRGHRFLSGRDNTPFSGGLSPAIVGDDHYTYPKLAWGVGHGRISGWTGHGQYPIRGYLDNIIATLKTKYPEAEWDGFKVGDLAEELKSSLGYDPIDGRTITYEDDSFLLANPRRASFPKWEYSSQQNREFHENDSVNDNPPKAMRPIIVADDNPLSLSLLTQPNKIALVEYVGMQRQVSRSHPMQQSSTPWRYQNVFQTPWIMQNNVTGKMFGAVNQLLGTPSPVDGLFIPYNYAHTPYHDTIRNQFREHYGIKSTPFSYYGTFEVSGNSLIDDSTLRMHELLDVFHKTRNDYQVGPNLSDSSGYAYSLRHILKDNEIISNIADLVSAELVFGAEYSSRNVQNDFVGLGVGTSDVLYPTYTIGNSYASYRIAPERAFSYLWGDGQAPFPQAGSVNSTRDIQELSTIRYDITWQLNEVLWDEYFFSTLPYRDKELGAGYNSTDYWNPSNPRLKYVDPSIPEIFYGYGNTYVPTTVADRRYLESDYDMNAARLWIKGPFNVNSTNVDAWKAVLATSFGTTVHAIDQTQRANSNTAPFPRNGIPYSANPITSSSQVSGNEQNIMTGYRTLSLDELECLAVSMVENVKDRGPFYSLADFVNRTVELRAAEVRRMHDKGLYDLTEDIYSGTALDDAKAINQDRAEFRNEEYYAMHNHMQKGVIQSAIDMTDINSAFFERPYLINVDDGILNARFENLTSEPMSAAGSFLGAKIKERDKNEIQNIFNSIRDPRNVWENWRAVLGSSLVGAPSYLTQADILKQIGSFITVRGDTFKIRAYGEVRNPLTNIIESKAWCEMVVQRYPEYVDTSVSSPADIENRERELGLQNDSENDSIIQDFTEAGTPVNIHLGRRFKVVSFRWLSELEV